MTSQSCAHALDRCCAVLSSSHLWDAWVGGGRCCWRLCCPWACTSRTCCRCKPSSSVSPRCNIMQKLVIGWLLDPNNFNVCADVHAAACLYMWLQAHLTSKQILVVWLKTLQWRQFRIECLRGHDLKGMLNTPQVQVAKCFRQALKCDSGWVRPDSTHIVRYGTNRFIR